MKKVLAWLKTYWYFPVSLLVVVVLALLSKDSNIVLELLSEKKEKYEKEKKQIEKQEKIKKALKEKNLLVYNKKLRELKLNHELEMKELETLRKKKIEMLKEEYDKDPKNFAKKIAQQHGWEYIARKKKDET